ncbi:hypothetical protein [Winogradskyella luteola]|uniref:Uncharacterized protein n=1 Tax=Winogradskyella luteola TaxID=2828330 RepID=A0A9X1FAT4_9FLAO|nr:hypothetical protein [Winogradskyella luteola]MBV7270752.1 hypothetical protein [Winogradskyella luteola]
MVLSIVSSISNLRSNSEDEKTVFKNQTEASESKKTDTIEIQISEKIDILNDRIENLTYNLIGFDDYYIPTDNEFLIYAGFSVEPKVIFKSKDDNTLKVKVSDVSEKEEKGKITPQAYLSFYIDDKKIGLEGVKQIIRINSSNRFWYEDYNGELIVNELDTIKLFKLKYVVERIYRKQSKSLVIADDKNAILLKEIKKDSTQKK